MSGLVEAIYIAPQSGQPIQWVPRADLIAGRGIRGIALNELVGREFTLGGAVISGVELCEPCATLGRRLSTTEVSPAAVVAAFTHRAGLRARIVSGGTVQPSDRLSLTTLFTRVELRFASLRRRWLLLIDALDGTAMAGPEYGCVVGGLIAR
jgi:hypothetical protein